MVKDLVIGVDPVALPELYLDALQAAWGRAEDAEEEEHENSAKEVQSLSFCVMQVRISAPENDVSRNRLTADVRVPCF